MTKESMNAAAAAAKLLQSCPTLCDPIDGSPPRSSVPGILQARTLEWVAISFSNAWKWKVKVKSLGLATPWTAAYQAPPSMGFSRQEYWSGEPLPSLENQWIKRRNSNVCASNIGATKYMNQKLINLQGEIDKSTVLVRYFNTLILITDRVSRHKISKDIVEQTTMINQIDLVDIYRTLYQIITKYTFFSSVHRIFTRMWRLPWWLRG